MEQPVRASVLSHHQLACLARADMLNHLDMVILPHTEGEVADQRPHLSQAGVPSRRPVMTLAAPEFSARRRR
jgi:hypothetical protein